MKCSRQLRMLELAATFTISITRTACSTGSRCLAISAARKICVRNTAQMHYVLLHS